MSRENRGQRFIGKLDFHECSLRFGKLREDLRKKIAYLDRAGSLAHRLAALDAHSFEDQPASLDFRPNQFQIFANIVTS